MKEIKTFFTNDNRLNKGYTKTQNLRESDKSHYRKKFEHILPPIDLISEYESLNPGTLAKMIDMAEREQHHKHAIDLINIESYNRTKKIGRIFAVLLVFFICITTLLLTIYASIMSSMIFCITAFLSIAIGSIMATKKSYGANKYNKKEDNQQ